MQNKLTRELAILEVESWLNFKQIGDRKREANKASVDTIIDAIMEGTLSLKEDKTFVHTLKFDTGGEIPVKVLEYSPRLKVSVVKTCLQGVAASDADGRICAYVAALTSKATGIINALDTEDYSLAQSIAVFFL